MLNATTLLSASNHCSELIIVKPFNKPLNSFEVSFSQGKEVIRQFPPDGDNTRFVHLVEIVSDLLLGLNICLEYLKFCCSLRQLVAYCHQAIIYICLCMVLPC